MTKRKPETERLSPEELEQRVIRFYERYGMELERIKDLLEIKLKQLALAYTINHQLPEEAVVVKARVKSQRSFLKKLRLLKHPQFYYPTEVIGDLIGARIVCWFRDDCDGMIRFMKASSQMVAKPNSIKNYYEQPKESGYRSIHLAVNVGYDGVKNVQNKVKLVQEKMLCEVQVRTKLQDAFGDVTHEFHYKAKLIGVDNPSFEKLMANISKRLDQEDDEILQFRKIYQDLADEKLERGQREGFRDE